MNSFIHITHNPLRIAAAALALAAAFATAVRADEAPQLHVKYADLNLNTAAGATRLYRRIQGAANHVCGQPQERELAQVERVKACVTQAVAAAVATVNSPTLTRVYAVKSGKAPESQLAAR